MVADRTRCLHKRIFLWHSKSGQHLVHSLLLCSQFEFEILTQVPQVSQTMQHLLAVQNFMTTYRTGNGARPELGLGFALGL